MGASLVCLEKPDKTKHSTDGSNDKFVYGACSMQGWRLNQEDAHIHNLDFDTDTALFGVFDGHGGNEVSIYTERHLEDTVKGLEEYKLADYENAFIKSFIKIDEQLGSAAGKAEMTDIHNSTEQKQSPLMQILKGDQPGAPDAPPGGEELQLDAKGCTANVVMIKGDIIYCANAGDSRAVNCNKGVAENLSEDHKPDDKIEKDRIYKAGSTVTEGRVDGNLNLSRSIGDLKHKQVPGLSPAEQPITCVPDVKKRKLVEGDEFIVCACDGIWEQKTSQEIIDFVRARIDTQPVLSKIVEELFEDLISPDYTQTNGLGCDNMTCEIIKFK